MFGLLSITEAISLATVAAELAGEPETIKRAIELMGIGMGGIFIVMILLFLLSKVLLVVTVPKKGK